MNRDEYGEIVNGSGTYRTIAKTLSERSSCVIGWSEGASTHFDILFALRPQQLGKLQFGQSGAKSLFVAISHVGCFGFSAESAESSAGYVGEKLGIAENSPTTKALAELLNGVRKTLKETKP